MNNIRKIMTYILPVATGLDLSVFLKCVLDFLAITISPFGGADKYPRYSYFTFICGVLSFILGIYLIYQLYLCLKNNTKKRAYVILSVTFLELVASVFFFGYVVDDFFALLQKTF